MNDYFLENPHAITITVIGAGGTGSLILQHLARVHCALQAMGKKGIHVTMIDDDIVTEANIGRQLYTFDDIGRNKATCLIERVNRFYGTVWDSIPRKFDKNIYYLPCLPGNIIISCVDNVATRKEIKSYIGIINNNRLSEYIYNHFWIDTGNSFDLGQVILGSVKNNLPDVLDRHPDLHQFEDLNSDPSCSLAEALTKQDLAINPYIALCTFNLIWDILTKSELNWCGAYISLKKDNPIKKIKIVKNG